MVVQYSNMTVVEAPLGFAVPFKVADVAVTETADPVAAVGWVISTANDVATLPTFPKESFP